MAGFARGGNWTDKVKGAATDLQGKKYVGAEQ
jgi:hypothetical protein